MSQKIHPIGLRVGLHRKWNNSWFETQKHYTQILHESFLLEKLLKSLLNYNFHKKALLINCKFIKHSYDSLIIIVFFYRYRYKKNFTNELPSEMNNVSHLFPLKKSNYLNDINDLKFLNKLKVNLNSKKSLKTFNYIFYKQNLNKNLYLKILQKNIINDIKQSLIEKHNFNELCNLLTLYYDFKLKNLKFVCEKQLKSLDTLSAVNQKQIFQQIHNDSIFLNHLKYSIKFINQSLEFKINKFKNFFENLINYTPYLNFNWNNNNDKINLFLNYVQTHKKLLEKNLEKKEYNLLITETQDLDKLIKISNYLSNINITPKTYKSLIKNLIMFKNKNILDEFNINLKDLPLNLQNYSFISKQKLYLNSNNMNLKLIQIIEKHLNKLDILYKIYNQKQSKKRILNLHLKNNLKLYVNFLYKFINEIIKLKQHNILKISIQNVVYNYKNNREYNNIYIKKLLMDLNTFENLFENEIIENNKQQNWLEPFKKNIEYILKSKVQIYFVNSLSFIKYQMSIHKRENLDFLYSLEKNLLRFYRYSAVYIQDLVYIAYISIFLKNPMVLAKFIGFVFENTPKNKKQTQLIKLIKNVMTSIISYRKEILGMRIKLKGRINRWRRTKPLYIQKQGNVFMPLQSYDARIAYGSSQARTQKGLLGIKVWLCYDKTFQLQLSKDLKNYILNTIKI